MPNLFLDSEFFKINDYQKLFFSLCLKEAANLLFEIGIFLAKMKKITNDRGILRILLTCFLNLKKKK